MGAAFIDGIAAACSHFEMALIGGDTIALPQGAPRVFGLTAIGRAGPSTPSRSRGKPEDRLWLVGTLGDPAGGPGVAGTVDPAGRSASLVEAYRRPLPLARRRPRRWCSHATAMMDVSGTGCCSTRGGWPKRAVASATIDARRDAACRLTYVDERGDSTSTVATVRGDQRGRRLCLARGASAGRSMPAALGLPGGNRNRDLHRGRSKPARPALRLSFRRRGRSTTPQRLGHRASRRQLTRAYPRRLQAAPSHP